MTNREASKVRLVRDVGFCVAYTLLGWAAATAALPWERRYKLSDYFVKNLWARGMLGFYGIKTISSGVENVDPKKTYVFISNHESLFDILCIFVTNPTSIRFVTKRELFFVPFFGQYLWAAGHIPIDRSNRKRAIASLKKAAERIADGTPIVAFPEGSRSTDDQVHPFKKGAFMLALEAGVPIIPVSISGSGKVLPKSALTATPGTIRIHYGEPISLEGLTVDDRDELIEKVRETIIRNKEMLDRQAD